MPQSDVLVLGLGLIGGATALYAMWRTVRRLVHVFDAVETASARMIMAVDLIIGEFAPNGGRLTEGASTATTKDLLLDVRTLLIAGEVNAVERMRTLIEVVATVNQRHRE